MAKIDLIDILTGYQSTVAVNSNYTDLATHLNDLVLYRNNPQGESNAMENDLDMNNFTILNAGTVDMQELILNGETVTALQNAPSTDYTIVNVFGYQSSVGDNLAVDTTSAVMRVRLPDNPVLGNTVNIADYAQNFGTNNLQIDAGFSRVNGVASISIFSSTDPIHLSYIDTTRGWISV